MSAEDDVDLERLALIVQGQSERNIMESSIAEYLGRLRTLTSLLWKNVALRELALELDAEGQGIEHTGQARGVFRLKMPVEVKTAKLLFALVSVSTTLPRQSKAVVTIDLATDEVEPVVVSTVEPAANKITVAPQTYQNYKSALKWWHAYDCPAMSKIGYPWPGGMDGELKKSIASYKRDVAKKRRRGVMKQKEGKSGYNLNGYIEMNKYMSSTMPHGRIWTWDAGIFSSLFTILSVNTIGRSDNIDDCLINNIGWSNDALTILFGNTKSDQTGETTSECKRLFANPFNPVICVVLKLAVYVFCLRRTLSGTGTMRLFEGEKQNKRYYTILMQVVKNLGDDVDLGCAPGDIGTHSNRKFSESTAASRVDGPSRTQVCLRAGQSVGKTQDCYMSSEEDGDALVGRTVAKLAGQELFLTTTSTENLFKEG